MLTLSDIAKEFSFFSHDPITGNVTFFNVDECEVCGCECLAPNELKVRGWGLVGHALAAGVVFRAFPVHELGACDALGGIAVCGACYKSE